MFDEDAIQKIRLALSTAGWNDVMRPAILNRGHQAVKALCMTASERSGPFKGLDDEALRATIRECEWMASVWHNEVLAFDQNRRLDELKRGTPTAANP